VESQGAIIHKSSYFL